MSSFSTNLRLTTLGNCSFTPSALYRSEAKALSNHYIAAHTAYRHTMAAPVIWLACVVILGVQAYGAVWSNTNTDGSVIRFWIYLFGFPLASLHCMLLYSWSIDLSFTGSESWSTIFRGVKVWLESWWYGVQMARETPPPRVLATLCALVLMPVVTLGMSVALAAQGWRGASMALVSSTTIVYTSLVQTISGIVRQDFGRLSVTVFFAGFVLSTICGFIAGADLPVLSISMAYYLLQSLLLSSVSRRVASTMQLGKYASTLIAYR